MKNFSIQRFGVLLRYDIVQNLRSYVFLMLGLFFGALLRPAEYILFFA